MPESAGAVPPATSTASSVTARVAGRLQRTRRRLGDRAALAGPEIELPERSEIELPEQV